ncbi:hypothetical protein CSUI_006366, partial [Cystoisospora suis]
MFTSSPHFASLLSILSASFSSSSLSFTSLFSSFSGSSEEGPRRRNKRTFLSFTSPIFFPVLSRSCSLLFVLLIFLISSSSFPGEKNLQRSWNLSSYDLPFHHSLFVDLPPPSSPSLSSFSSSSWLSSFGVIGSLAAGGGATGSIPGGSGSCKDHFPGDAAVLNYCQNGANCQVALSSGK